MMVVPLYIIEDFREKPRAPVFQEAFPEGGDSFAS